MAAHPACTPRLEHLKKQAKRLHRSHAAGDAEAYERIRASFPKLAGASIDEIRRSEVWLQYAQLVVAREHGFDSWPKLQ